MQFAFLFEKKKSEFFAKENLMVTYIFIIKHK